MTEKDRRAAGRQPSETLPQIDDLCRILHPLLAVRVVKELSSVWHYRSQRVDSSGLRPPLPYFACGRFDCILPLAIRGSFHASEAW